MNRKRTILCFLILVLAAGFNTLAQSKEFDSKTGNQQRAWWLNLGVGLFATNANISYQTRNIIFSLRFARMGALDDFDLQDTGLLIGIGTKSKSTIFTVGVGLGIIEGSFSQGGYSKSLASIPMETQVFFRVTTKIWLGIYGMLNVNHEKTVGNVCLNIQFRIS
jgi:hypothetical protein